MTFYPTTPHGSMQSEIVSRRPGVGARVTWRLALRGVSPRPPDLPRWPNAGPPASPTPADPPNAGPPARLTDRCWFNLI